MEEEILLELTDELSARVDSLDESVEVYFEQEEGRNYVFCVGEEKYYATLFDLPTHVESHKLMEPKDPETPKNMYKLADLGQILKVSNTRVFPGSQRPVLDESCSDFVLNDGLTPPMSDIKKLYKDREKQIDNSASKSVVKFMNDKLEDLEIEVMKREKNANKEAEKNFIYEEVIDEEPFMQYWDEVTTFLDRADTFKKDAESSFNLAFQRHKHKVQPKSFGQAAPAPKKRPVSEISHMTQNMDNIDLKKNQKIRGLETLINAAKQEMQQTKNKIIIKRKEQEILMLSQQLSQLNKQG